MKKLILFIIFAFLLPLNSNAKVTEDYEGMYQIDTFPENQSLYPQLMYFQTYSPFDGEGISKLEMGGRADTLKCAQFIKPKKTAARLHIELLMKEVIKITEDKYIVSISVSICHPDWYVIYLHDGEKWAKKPVYDKVWNAIKGE